MGHILIVEDDADIRDSLTEVLNDVGFSAVSVPGAREALAWLETADPLPCLIFLDYMMPEMDGGQFMAVKRELPRIAAIPVVIVSAVHNLAERAAAVHADGFLRKPFDLEDLLARARSFCPHMER